ncbi:hypothetical protein CDS [Bradyrhizobium sp.]|nr:hypothetical protein CDS [Bradyrhizobium sp.]
MPISSIDDLPAQRPDTASRARPQALRHSRRQRSDPMTARIGQSCACWM